MFELLTARDDDALLHEFARFVEFWCGPPDRDRPELPDGIPRAVAMLVALNEERSTGPFDASDRLLRPDELVRDERGDLFFIDTHQMGRVIRARSTPTSGEASAVFVDVLPDQEVLVPLAHFSVGWGLAQLVFNSPKELHEVELVPVCERFDLPLLKLWEGSIWPESRTSFYLCNEQVLSFDDFNGYRAMDDVFRASIANFYPKIRAEYLE